jgi:hypothetical protein
VWDVERRELLSQLHQRDDLLLLGVSGQNNIATDFSDNLLVFNDDRVRVVAWASLFAPEETKEAKKKVRVRTVRMQVAAAQRDLAFVDPTKFVLLDRRGAVGIYDFHAANLTKLNVVFVACDRCF